MVVAIFCISVLYLNNYWYDVYYLIRNYFAQILCLS